MLKKQQGFTLIEMVVVIVILAAVSVAWQAQRENVEQPAAEAVAGATYMDSLSKSSMAFYMDNRRWPADVNELANSPAYMGNTVSPYGSTPTFSLNSGLLSIALDSQSKASAVRLKSGLAKLGVLTTEVNESELSLFMDEPTESSIQSYFLARREVPGCPGCNTLETDIDANGYDINQVRELTGDNAEFTSADFQSATIDNLTSESIRMAGVTIRGNGNRLTVDANEMNVTGDLSGDRGQFDRVQADTFRGNDFFGDDFVTDVTSTNENRRLLDELQREWNTCKSEGNCK